MIRHWPEFLTLAEVAAIARVTEKTVRGWIDSGELECTRPKGESGRELGKALVPRAAVAKLLNLSLEAVQPTRKETKKRAARNAANQAYWGIQSGPAEVSGATS